MTSKRLFLETSVDIDDLPQQIVDEIRDRDEIMEFILAVDYAVEDYDFTVNLRDKLDLIISEEDATAFPHDAA